MSPTDLPNDVRRFLLGAIASVPHLEALLLLRHDAARAWTPAQVAERLFLPEERGAAILAELRQQGLLAEAGPGAYVYAPGGAELRHTIDRLAAYYSRHVVEVSRLLHAKIERQALEFSDAFRLRKDK